MSLKEQVFQWCDLHQMELKKTGYNANEELRKSFPNHPRKTLSNYKCMYLREQKRDTCVPEKTLHTKPTESPDNDIRVSVSWKHILFVGIPFIIGFFWLLYRLTHQKKSDEKEIIEDK